MSTNAQLVEATNKHLIPNYGRLSVAMVRGKGARLWDADGKEYIDFFAGFGAGGVSGHSHPAVAAAIKAQADLIQCCGNLFTNEPQTKLAEGITRHGFGGKVFFCHSGAEANEAALKLARLAASQAAGRPLHKIISFNNCFHGRTMGALSLTPEKFQKGFEPMLPGNVKVDLGDLGAVAAAIDDQTAGVFIEPIQGEGGMHVPEAAFVQGLRKLCDERGLLLVVDEVWTAPARTGKWYGYQLHGVEPDVMTLGKAVGGGAPVAACVAGPKWQDVLQPGKHGCTLGGNPLCAAAGAAVYKLIEDEDLVAAAKRKGAAIVKQLKAAKIGKVKDIRGAGLMLGIELDSPGADVFKACLAKGLYINCTAENVLRIHPPCVIDEKTIEQGMEILIGVLKA
ncbi:MAG: aspartate aminotransferase family protein [Phycisphaerae bacterium]